MRSSFLRWKIRVLPETGRGLIPGALTLWYRTSPPTGRAAVLPWAVDASSQTNGSAQTNLRWKGSSNHTLSAVLHRCSLKTCKRWTLRRNRHPFLSLPPPLHAATAQVLCQCPRPAGTSLSSHLHKFSAWRRMTAGLV